MKPFVAALLVCMVVSMSGFTVVNPLVHKSVKTITSWPLTGTRGSYEYTITGSGNTPEFITFRIGSLSKGSFQFLPTGTIGLWEADVPATSSVYTTVHDVELGIYVNQEGYTLTFHPDF
jgi:hypothetical protein